MLYSMHEVSIVDKIYENMEKIKLWKDRLPNPENLTRLKGTVKVFKDFAI